MARMVGVKRYGDKFHGDILVLENDHIQITALSLEISQECLIVGAKLLSLRRKESSSDNVPLIKRCYLYVYLL